MVPFENPVSAVVRGIDDATRLSYRPSVNLDGGGGGCLSPGQGRHALDSTDIQSHYMIVERAVPDPAPGMPPQSSPSR